MKSQQPEQVRWGRVGPLLSSCRTVQEWCLRAERRNQTHGAAQCRHWPSAGACHAADTPKMALRGTQGCAQGAAGLSAGARRRAMPGAPPQPPMPPREPKISSTVLGRRSSLGPRLAKSPRRCQPPRWGCHLLKPWAHPSCDWLSWFQLG